MALLANEKNGMRQGSEKNQKQMQPDVFMWKCFFDKKLFFCVLRSLITHGRLQSPFLQPGYGWHCGEVVEKRANMLIILSFLLCCSFSFQFSLTTFSGSVQLHFFLTSESRNNGREDKSGERSLKALHGWKLLATLELPLPLFWVFLPSKLSQFAGLFRVMFDVAAEIYCSSFSRNCVWNLTCEQSSPIHPILHRHVPGFVQYPFCLLQLGVQIAGWGEEEDGARGKAKNCRGDDGEVSQLRRKSYLLNRWRSHLVRRENLANRGGKYTRAVSSRIRACSRARLGSLCRFFPSIRCDTLTKEFFSH